MPIEADEIIDVGPNSRLTYQDVNQLKEATRQLLNESSSTSPTVKLAVGSETWTLAGYKDSSNNRYLLLKWSEVASLTTSNMDALIPLQLINQ